MSFFGLDTFQLTLGFSIVAGGGVLTYYLTRGPGARGKGRIKKYVTFLMPGERRGVELLIERETDFGLYTRKTEGVTRRFIKLARGFTIKRGNQSVITFFGLEGKIFTAAPGRVLMKRSVAEFLKFLWGEDFYTQIPEPERKIVEKDEVGVTIEIDPADMGDVEAEDEEEAAKIAKLSSVDINAESDATVLTVIAETNKQKDTSRRELYQMIIGVGLGMGLMLLLITQGIIKV